MRCVIFIVYRDKHWHIKHLGLLIIPLFPSLSRFSWMLCSGFFKRFLLNERKRSRGTNSCANRVVINHCKINKSSATRINDVFFVSKPTDDDARKCWLIRVHAFEILGSHSLFVSPGYTARLQRIMLTKFQLPGCLHLFSKCPFVYNTLNTGIRLNMYTTLSRGFHVNCKPN